MPAERKRIPGVMTHDTMERCPFCRYNLRGHATPSVCPECGRAFPAGLIVIPVDSRNHIFFDACSVAIGLFLLVASWFMLTKSWVIIVAGCSMVLIGLPNVLSRFDLGWKRRFLLVGDAGVLLTPAIRSNAHWHPWSQVRHVSLSYSTGDQKTVRKRAPLSAHRLGVHSMKFPFEFLPLHDSVPKDKGLPTSKMPISISVPIRVPNQHARAYADLIAQRMRKAHGLEPDDDAEVNSDGGATAATDGSL